MLWYEWLVLGLVFCVASAALVLSVFPFTIPIKRGGTAATSVPLARANLGIPEVIPITSGGTGAIDVTSARKALSIPTVLPILSGGTGVTNVGDLLKVLGVSSVTTTSFSFPGNATAPLATASNNTGFYDDRCNRSYTVSGVYVKIGNDYIVFGMLSSSYVNGESGKTACRGLLPFPIDPVTYTAFGGLLGGFVGADTIDESKWNEYSSVGYIVQNQSSKGVYLYNTWTDGFGDDFGPIQIQYVVYLRAN